MISRVELKNWRSHLESTLTFSSGTNALLGPLGSGKTSILDAICFGLFGTFPNLQMKKLKLDDIIMRKPEQKDRAEVEVHFQVNGTTYSVKRIVERGKGTSYSEIKENGKLLESPNAQRVTEIVEQILKVDYELFSKAIYSEQNALDYFLTIPKGQRMRKIDELLAIDKFEKSRSNAVMLTNRVADRKVGVESAISRVNEEELKKNVSELEESIRKLLFDKEEQKKIFEKTVEERRSLEAEMQELQKVRENLEILKRDERGIESALEEMLVTIRSLEESVRGFSKESVQRELEELVKSVDMLNQELKQSKDSYERIFSEISQAKSKLDFVKEEKVSKLDSLLKEKMGIKKEFDRLLDLVGANVDEQIVSKKKMLERMTEEISAANTSVSDLRSFIEHLSSAENKCPVCDSVLTPEKKKLLIKQKQDQIERMEEGLAVLKKDKESGEKELRSLEEAAKKIGEMYIQIRDLKEVQKDLEDSRKVFQELSSFLAQNENRLAGMKTEIGEAEKRLKESENRKRKYEILMIQLNDYEEKKRRQEELSRQIETLRTKIKEVESKLMDKDLHAMEERLKSVIGKEREAEAKLQSYDLFIKEKEARRQELARELENLANQKKEIQKLENIIKNLRIFSFALEQTQIELRSNFIETVNYSMNKLWQTLYPYQDFVAVRLNTEEGDYILQLQGRDGRWVNVEGVVSGGERSIACLALRIAFALVLAPQLGMLILDEPSHNLDSVALRELATTLRERINEFIDQTFLITHETELEDAVTGRVYVLERDKTKDGATKVVAIS